MTGLILHPLRHKALSEGRLSVLRVPFREQPGKNVARLVKSASDLHWIEQYDNGDPLGVLTGKPTGKILYKADGQEVMLDDGDGSWAENKDGTFASPWSSPMHMKEEDARYVPTLGDPVPGKLGEVDVSAMQQEGTFASLMQDPCDMAKQIKDKYRDEWNTIYPRHPWSPDLWTWGYPVKWRRR